MCVGLVKFVRMFVQEMWDVGNVWMCGIHKKVWEYLFCMCVFVPYVLNVVM
jgi:hypothetical protein